MTKVVEFKPGNILSHSIDGEMVILNLDNEKYYTLDSVAARFWEVVLQHGKGQRSIRVLLDEYEIDEATLVSDLDRWLDELISLGLLVRIDSDE